FALAREQQGGAHTRMPQQEPRELRAGIAGCADDRRLQKRAPLPEAREYLCGNRRGSVKQIRPWPWEPARELAAGWRHIGRIPDQFAAWIQARCRGYLPGARNHGASRQQPVALAPPYDGRAQEAPEPEAEPQQVAQRIQPAVTQ